MTLQQRRDLWTPGNGGLSSLLVAEVSRVAKITADGRPARRFIKIGRTRGTLVVTEEWISLDFPPPSRRPRRPDRLLAANAGLWGNVRHVFVNERTIALRAEVPLTDIPLDGPGGVVELLRFSLAGLAGVFNSQVGEPRTPPPNTPTPRLSDLCQVAGWQFSPRADGRVYVDLEVSGGAFFQAEVSREDCGIALRVDPLHDQPPGQEIVSRAVAALLLTISGCVRMVSAVSEPGTGGASASPALGLRVMLPANASATVLNHALCALSGACQLGGQEARALAEDAELARRYLEIRHPRLLPRSARRRLGRQPQAHRPSNQEAGSQP